MLGDVSVSGTRVSYVLCFDIKLPIFKGRRFNGIMYLPIPSSIALTNFLKGLSRLHKTSRRLNFRLTASRACILERVWRYFSNSF